jgi:hypothetical protein
MYARTVSAILAVGCVRVCNTHTREGKQQRQKQPKSFVEEKQNNHEEVETLRGCLCVYICVCACL